MDETPEGTRDPIEYMRQERPRPNIADVMKRQERARVTNRRIGGARELRKLLRASLVAATALLAAGLIIGFAAELTNEPLVMIWASSLLGGGAWGGVWTFLVWQRWSRLSRKVTDDDLERS